MIHQVPDTFRPTIMVEYPPDNKQIFEEWFFDKVHPAEIPEGWVYLPVFWCSFQVNNDYGKGRKMADLQAYIDGLDRSKKYFTITQYDDGPLVDFKDLDITVFGSGGGRIDRPIPLVCMPHKRGPVKEIKDRKYLASFVGSINHPVRQKMLDVINALPQAERDRYYIQTDRVSIETFCAVMEDSVFALCPRGYGKTSFRIGEALQFGTTPVYISDEFIWPYEGMPDGGIDEFWGVWFDKDDIHKIHPMLTFCERNTDGHHFLSECEQMYDNWYRFGAVKERILTWLKSI